MRYPSALAPAFLTLAGLLPAQTTQAIVSGRVRDLRNNQALPAIVRYTNLATNEAGEVQADRWGFYTLPPISPGLYNLRAEYGKYQAQEVQDLTVYVAGRTEIVFPLRSMSDVLDAGTGNIVALPRSELVLPTIGPDLERGSNVAIRPIEVEHGILYATQSYVVDRTMIEYLPLTGRDVYAMLAMMPGVTAENATGRGLGFSVNGQRPSASNYLLDGVENNDYLVTGPLAVAAPEAIQEYRVSTGNFSAEYGRTSGFVTNAVTRGGADDWHGLGYFYLQNEALNANTFARNAGYREDSGLFGTGLARAPLKEIETGVQAAGPAIRGRLFHSTNVDRYRNRSSGSPQTVRLPTTTYLARTLPTLAATANARKLFERFAPPAVEGPGDVRHLEMNPSISIDRTLVSERIDFTPPNTGHRVTARGSLTRRSQPDFVWTPYTDFLSELRARTIAAAAEWTARIGSRGSNELRGSWSRSHLQWDRPHPEIPTLLSGAVDLPGSPASYGYRNDNHNIELLDNVIVSRGAHMWKAGGGVLWRRLSGHLTFGQAGMFLFDSLRGVAEDEPIAYTAGVDRQFVTRQPQYDRRYRRRQYFAFVEDSYKASERLNVNFGVRYENFGSPVNTGPVKDYRVRLENPAGIEAAIREARVEYPGPGDQRLYEADDNNWSARLGFAYDPNGRGRFVIRGAYGVFYDRPFDNLWTNLRNNNVLLASTSLAVKTDYLAPAAELVGRIPFRQAASFLLTYQPRMRDGYVQSYFLGGQYRVSDFLFEVFARGSEARKVVVTDIVNRDLSEPGGPFHPRIGNIYYRSNQGASSYYALTAVARYRARRAQFQASYTWGHGIDNQSEPLAGEFFNLRFSRAGGTSTNNATAAFSRQFDSRIDRGSSDFDQRHNLLFFSLHELPGKILRGWRVSELAAVRTGFPFTVFSNRGDLPLRGGLLLPSPRADQVDASRATEETPVTGGRRLLNRSAFRAPLNGAQGNTGRNAFRGPGLFSVDLSVSRTFALRESVRLVFRADAYNVLNHANLNNPGATLIESPDFGVARFGRVGRSSGFPAVSPLNETARQIQLMLRLQF